MTNKIAAFVFAITIFLSALLLFLIQPMIAKYFLPTFGSSSSVWTVAVLFFQTVLFIGYFYSHKLSSLRLSTQKYLHATTIISLLILQLYISRSWFSPVMPNPSLGASIVSVPEFRLLYLIAVGVGGLYFTLATTSTLLQSWLAKRSSSYWLYRVSNLGSFSAIVAYPFIVEPRFTLIKQGLFWFWGFGLYAILLLSIVFFFRTKGKDLKTKNENSKNYSSSLPKTKYLVWIFLAAIPSIQMLSFTNHITQGISPVPLLWLLPLGLYLVSFVIAFKKSLPKIKLLLLATFVFLTLTTIFRALELLHFVSLFSQIFFYSTTLFLVSILCHHLLYKDKPERGFLTHFYLALSFGGMLGGLFVAVLAPSLFKGLWEVDVSLILGLAVFFFVLKRYPGLVPGAFRKLKEKQVFTSFLLSLSTLLIGLIIKNRLDSTYVNRNFYGVVRVKDDKFIRSFFNGQILHGSQLTTPADAHRPTTYFSQDSGIGLTFEIYRKLYPKKGLKVGIAGLGVGTLAAYCEPKDSFTFYEINPQVVEVAQKYFSYLTFCTEVNVVVGDARLSLEKEPTSFDILVLDAFTDDAIPMHLLTLEAFKTYLERLEENGILAVQITNRNLDLRPLALGVGEAYNLSLIVVDNLQKGGEEIEEYLQPSLWVLLTRNQKFTGEIKFDANKYYGKEKVSKKVVWTDNHSNILQVLK